MVDKPTKNELKYANTNVEIVREGREIVLPAVPAPMTYRLAREYLKRKEQEEETEVSIQEGVDAFPWDGAHAFMLAMKEMFGWTQAVPTPGFFGENPPTFTSISTGPRTNDKTQIIWGRFQIPGIDGWVATNAHFGDDGRLQFQIVGEVKRKHQHVILELANRTRELVVERSIYRARAIRLRCDDDGDLDVNLEPLFLDTASVVEDELIFPDVTMHQIRTNLFTPVRKREFCIRHGIPLNRGILLEGPFGVGKTLCATVLAKICEENGWTFMMIDRARALPRVIDFAKIYGPCVVFAEDIDRVVSGNRDEDMDTLLNTIDGLSSKHQSIITVLTTNEVEKIHRAMLRPGRLDAVISITPPDADAAQKLMRLYARGLIPDGTELNQAGVELEGQIPATIREVVERSKLAALSHSDDGNISLTDHDLVVAAQGMKMHLDLLYGRKEAEPNDEEKLGIAFANLLGGKQGLTPKLRQALGAIQLTVGNVEQRTRDVQVKLQGAAKKDSNLGKLVKELSEVHEEVENLNEYVRENL